MFSCISLLSTSPTDSQFLQSSLLLSLSPSLLAFSWQIVHLPFHPRFLFPVSSFDYYPDKLHQKPRSNTNNSSTTTSRKLNSTKFVTGVSNSDIYPTRSGRGMSPINIYTWCFSLLSFYPCVLEPKVSLPDKFDGSRVSEGSLIKFWLIIRL